MCQSYLLTGEWVAYILAHWDNPEESERCINNLVFKRIDSPITICITSEVSKYIQSFCKSKDTCVISRKNFPFDNNVKRMNVLSLDPWYIHLSWSVYIPWCMLGGSSSARAVSRSQPGTLYAWCVRSGSDTRITRERGTHRDPRQASHNPQDPPTGSGTRVPPTCTLIQMRWRPNVPGKWRDVDPMLG